MRLLFFAVLFIALKPVLFAQTTDPLLTPDANEQLKWVDSIYASMTLDEKIMVQAFSNKGLRH